MDDSSLIGGDYQTTCVVQNCLLQFSYVSQFVVGGAQFGGARGNPFCQQRPLFDQHGLGALALGHVLLDGDKAYNNALGGIDRRHRSFIKVGRAIFALADTFCSPHLAWSQGAPMDKIIMSKVATIKQGIGAPHKFIRAIPSQTTCSRIGILNQAAGGDDQDRAGDSSKDLTVIALKVRRKADGERRVRSIDVAAWAGHNSTYLTGQQTHANATCVS